MSLRVWLPLTKDLRNQGLDEVEIINYGATFDSEGKLGGCYYFDGIDDRIVINGLVLPNIWSYSCWIYSATSSRGWEAVIMLNSTGGDADLQLGFYTYPAGNRIQNTANGQYNTGISWTYGMWHHFCGTFNGSSLKTYIDGILVDTKNITASLLTKNHLTIGAKCNNSTNTSASLFFQGKLNDVRIYDHCLSPLEVKQISQGLILHYPLNRNGWGQENLLKNSNDLTLWNKEIGVKCEYDLTVKMYKVFSTTRESSRWGIYQDYSVSVDVDTEYTFSLTGKTDGFRSYLSFGAGSSWPTNYTAFDNNKQRLSKTLTIPAGTTNIRVYLAMYPTTGGGYTYFEKPKLEIGNKATPWCPNSSDELATTLGMNDNIEYDCSGFGNNGEYYAYDTNGSINYTSDTPKYNVSTHIASANPTQHAASGTRYLYGHCELTNPTQMSVAFWLKPITGGYGGTTSSGQGYFCTTNYEYGYTYSVGSDYQDSAMNHRDGAVDMNDSASTTQCRVTFYPTIGEWHHYVYTYDGQVGRGYKDGVQTATAQFSAAKTLDSFIGVVIGFSKAGGVWRRNDACYSDFRVYATALSAEDVLDLYNLGAAIDTNNNLYTYEVTE